MKKFLTIVSLALLLVAFGAMQWGQAGQRKAHQLKDRVVQLEQRVTDLEAQVVNPGDPCEGPNCPAPEPCNPNTCTPPPPCNPNTTTGPINPNTCSG